MNETDWNALEIGDMVCTTKRMFVVGAVAPGKAGLNRLQLHKVLAAGCQYTVKEEFFFTSDPEYYAPGGKIPGDAEFEDGRRFWGGGKDVSASDANEAKFLRALQAGFAAFCAELERGA